MQFLASYQLTEIDCIFRNNYSVFCKATRKHDMIQIAQATHVARVYRIMLTRLIEVTGELWRQAFVDEEPQAAFAQGRPPGLPTMGWVRA